jgi:uncharacterized protein
MQRLPSTWFDRRLARRPSAIHGHGLFTTASMLAGEVVMIWGGTFHTVAELRSGAVPGHMSYSIVDDDLAVVGPGDADDYFVNHSCDPTVWMADEVTVVARRDLRSGEEIVGDYAVWESDPRYRIESCRCGTHLCRGRFSGDDWMRPELQHRYRGHFLPFIERRITGRSQP